MLHHSILQPIVRPSYHDHEQLLKTSGGIFSFEQNRSEWLLLTGNMHPNIRSNDEGFTDQSEISSVEGEYSSYLTFFFVANLSPELAYKLLASLPRSRLAIIQRRITPLLQFDVAGVRSAPLSYHTLLVPDASQ